MRWKLLPLGLALFQWLFIAVVIFIIHGLRNAYIAHTVLWIATFCLLEWHGLTRHRSQQVFGWLTMGLVVMGASFWYVATSLPADAYCHGDSPNPRCFLSSRLVDCLLLSCIFHLPVVLITLVSWLRRLKTTPTLVIPTELMQSIPPAGAEPVVVREVSWFTPLLAVTIFGFIFLMSLTINPLP